MTYISFVVIGFCMGVACAAPASEKECTSPKTDLTIGIDNSKDISKEEFESTKAKVKDLLKVLPLGEKEGEIMVSVHTFGANAYKDDEVEWTANYDKLAEGIDNLAYHGDTVAKPYQSWNKYTHHLRQNMADTNGGVGVKHMYIYVGNRASTDESQDTEVITHIIKDLKATFIVLQPQGELFPKEDDLLKNLGNYDAFKFGEITPIKNGIEHFIAKQCTPSQEKPTAYELTE